MAEEAVIKEIEDQETPKEEKESLVVDKDSEEEVVKADEEPKTSEESEADDADSKDQDEDQDEEEAEGAPDEYEEFKMPEGMKEIEGVVDEFKEVAKELNLSQENAQKLIDLQTKAMSRVNDQVEERYNEIMNEWIDAAQNDNEVGGKKFDENVSKARKVVEAFGNDDLKDMLNNTGTGNHVELIRFLVKIHDQGIGEDKIMSIGNKDVDRVQDVARKLYPSMEK